MLSAGDRARIATCVGEHDIRVQYGDAANPVRVGTVVEVNRAGDNFRVVWDDDGLAAGFGDETWSDLRQYGWHILPTEPLGSTWPRAAGIVDNHVERMLDGGCATFGRTDDGHDDPAGYA